MTQWTLIHRVNEGSDAESARAMEEICRQYWYPIYAFTRRSGFTPEDAEDLTQVFFQRMIASGTIQAARQERGQLRSFMLSLLKRVIANHHRDTHREKRGGSPSATVSWDDLAAEQRYTHEPVDCLDSETLFTRAWAQDLLQVAEIRLRSDFLIADNLTAYEQLREFLPLGENARPYADVARKLGITESTLGMQIHRMRKRYAKLIEEEISNTVTSAEEGRSELASLMNAAGH